MEANQRGALHRLIKVAFDCFPDITAQLSYGFGLGVDAVSEGAGRISAIDFVLCNFKDDF